MNCPFLFTKRFLCEHFPKTFLDGEYRDMRSEVLFSLEKSRLPESMVEANMIQRKNRYATEYQKARDLSADVLNRIQQEIVEKFPGNDHDEEDVERIENYNLLLKSKYAVELFAPETWSHLLANITERLRVLKYGEGATRKKVDGDQVVARCPKINCNGYVTAKAWRCGICNNKICASCHKSKLEDTNEIDENGNISSKVDKDHVCDPNEVASVKMLASETKPCPKCALPIIKVAGCDQMWATCCNIAFNWRTGAIIRDKATFHNPEYTEFLARRGRVREGDMYRNNVNNRGLAVVGMNDNVPAAAPVVNGNCETMPGIEEIMEFLWKYAIDPDNLEPLIELWRQIIELRDMRIGVRNVATDHNDLRVKFLIGEIDEQKFKTDLFKRIKALEKTQEFDEVQEMFQQGTTEICRRMIASFNPKKANILDHQKLLIEQIKQTVTELSEFITYTDETYSFVCKMFNSKAKFINTTKLNDVIESLSAKLADFQPRVHIRRRWH
jgi:hypothetical protein